ncbi:MAG TPA: pyridoxamine 5'-phosphate oxidase family protein [Ghiorsea sp.]|nr:pyridoxamine 5'-phosphate oxidase family protein [Ghiorsea sp.]
MGNTFTKLDDKSIAFIKAQKMFFVATAPVGSDGHVNVSPKGYDCFKIIDANTVAYLDLGGSGIETLAHLKQNGRITIMFCAYEGKANILRLYGKGSAVSFDEPGFEDALALFPNFSRARSIITIKINRVADSCGFGVPFYDFVGERDQLMRSAHHRSESEWKEYRYMRNPKSIDGLEGLVKPK